MLSLVQWVWHLPSLLRYTPHVDQHDTSLNSGSIAVRLCKNAVLGVHYLTVFVHWRICAGMPTLVFYEPGVPVLEHCTFCHAHNQKPSAAPVAMGPN